MEIKNKELDPVSCGGDKLSAALGFFDGVHIGHRALLKKAIEKAKELGLRSAVWTFKQNYKGTFIDTEDEKRDSFKAEGIETAVFEDFFSLKDMSPEDFVEKILINKLGCGAIVCGFDFRFGKDAKGDVALLEKLLKEKGVSLSVIEPVKLGNTVVSSSLIKEYVSDGRIEEANAMLGRRFYLNSPVLHGKALGRTLGFPTINQKVTEGRICPKNGVYFSEVFIDGEKYCGLTNIGKRPTVEDSDAINAETYVFGLDRDVYNKTVRVELCKMWRDEKRFSSKEELQKSIKNDAENARKYFNI
ncbi:MAG: bifunctional riboflavin kinase/FAD synthetase [Ruminococcaceae bacterium]|nr:bifunctional riboflavin kinase/FAD synthetase [Oscillospiraceae bacterium]